VRAAEAVNVSSDDFHNRLVRVVPTATGWRIQVRAAIAGVNDNEAGW
jgi:hypothetical protein